MKKLKPCPFCGEVGALEVREEEHFCGCPGKNKWKSVYCPPCGTTGPSHCRKDQAVKAWNWRAKEVSDE